MYVDDIFGFVIIFPNHFSYINYFYPSYGYILYEFSKF